MNQKGFTLLEVMISLMIFSVVVGGMAPAFVAQLRHNTDSETRTEAVAAAQMTLDAQRLTDTTTMPHSGSTTPQNMVVGNHTFSVVTYYCLTSAYCASNNNRQLTVRVSLNNQKIFETSTVFTQLR